MRWPGVIEPGSRNSQITAIIDLLPTFCAIAGVDPPNDRVIDGRNILAYMRGERVKKPIHESFIVPGPVKDPHERTNQIDNPKYATTVETLRALVPSFEDAARPLPTALTKERRETRKGKKKK